MMGQRAKLGLTQESMAEREMRDQEVLRANRELAAYFKGRRTEREARAALKIIKAFVHDRERQDARSRSPLPGAVAAKTPKRVTNGKATNERGERHRRKARRIPQPTLSKRATVSIHPEENPNSPHSPESARTPE
jgi:hypothetical protein